MLRSLVRHFLDGLVMVLPAGLTVYVGYLILKLMYNLFSFSVIFLPERIRDWPGMAPAVTIATCIAFFILITLVGYSLKSIIGRWLERIIELTFGSVPGLKALYKAFKKLLDVLYSKQGAGGLSSLSKVVLFEYPHRGKWAVGFLTGPCDRQLSPDETKEYFTVFMPTTPNPAFGNLMVVAKEDIRSTDMTMDEAVKLVMSGGIIKD